MLPDVTRDQQDAAEGESDVQGVHVRARDTRFGPGTQQRTDGRVLVHSNPVYEPGTRGAAVVDIFRFDKRSGLT